MRHLATPHYPCADDNETFVQRTGPRNGEVAGEEEPQYILQSQKAKAFMALVGIRFSIAAKPTCKMR